MKITQEYIDLGVKYIHEYEDADSFDHLPYGQCTQCYAVCLYNDKMVIGFSGRRHWWSLIGGTVEPGETYEQTLKREVQEESNMEVLNWKPVGYQKVINTQDGTEIFQLRFVCLVRPYGPFESDPAGTVTEIKLIDPKDYKKYFDWGEKGDRIVSRALELAKEM